MIENIIDYSTGISTEKINSCTTKEELIILKNIILETILQIKLQYEEYKTLSPIEKEKKQDWKHRLKIAKTIKGHLVSQIDYKLQLMKQTKKVSKLERIINLIKFWK